MTRPSSGEREAHFPLDTVGLEAAIVAAQRLVRSQPKAERSAALDAFGPRTC